MYKGKVAGINNHTGQDEEGLPYSCWQLVIVGNGEIPSSVFGKWMNLELAEEKNEAE